MDTEPPEPPEPVAAASFDNLVPRPSELTRSTGSFTLSRQTPLAVADGADADDAARLLAGYLAPYLGGEPDVAEAAEGPAVVFTSKDAPEDLGPEGYVLNVTPERVEVTAGGRAGFLWAVQTLRQGVAAGFATRGGSTAASSTSTSSTSTSTTATSSTTPSSTTSTATPQETPGPVELPAVTIRDVPRFAWRGVMLDVARHFFGTDVVKSLIDLAASFKLNRFHLHLTDDQGWRLQSSAYPELTEIGAQTEVGGGSGGYYTLEEYADIVDHAARRGVMIVPEIDMPGHTQAALASLPWLNCEGTPPPSVRDTAEFEFTSLCLDQEQTYDFVDTVIGELAEATPGPYIHIGGDEAHSSSDQDYSRFIERAVEAVRDAGKTAIGWEEISRAEVGADTVTQVWLGAPEDSERTAARGGPVIMSLAKQAYLDMKYDESTPVGQTWAGFIDTEKAYGWDPVTAVPGLDASQVMGVEACLWTEFVETPEQIELLLLPRLAASAEVAWTAQDARDWDDFRTRVATFGPQWEAAGTGFTRDPVVPWP